MPRLTRPAWALLDMRPHTLQALTWLTIVAAIVSALWLAAFESDTDSGLRLNAPLAAAPRSVPANPRAIPGARQRSDGFRARP